MKSRFCFAWLFCAVFFSSIEPCLAGEDRSMPGEPSTPMVKSWPVGDVLVTNPAIDEVKPSMTSAPNGDLYTVVEEVAANWIRLYRSTDGGDTWVGLYNYRSGADSRNPSVAYGEHTNGEKWVYIAYEEVDATGVNRQVRVIRVDENGAGVTWSTIDGPFIMNSTSDEVHPQIITDLVDWGDLYYVYLTYATFSIDGYPIKFSRSQDRGASWSAPLDVTGSSQLTGWPARPEIAYGSSGLFITFVKPGWTGGSWSNQIWVTKSSSAGSSFAAPVQLTTTTNNVFHPAVAAAHGVDSVVVAYTTDYGSDMDVRFVSSIDGGATWGLTGPLPWTLDHESSVDLTVSNSNGHFHAAYKHEATAGGSDIIWYTQASTANPAGWSPALPINEGEFASGISFYPRPTITVMPGLPSGGEAAIAWTDWRGALYDVYFGTAAIFADGFESGDATAWSSAVGLVDLVTLLNGEGYDFSERTSGSITHGDFYFSSNSGAGRFWANNVGMRGLVDLGVTTGSLEDVTVPASGYYMFGVEALLGHTYVSLAEDGEADYYIIFRVTAVSSAETTLDWIYVHRP